MGRANTTLIASATWLSTRVVTAGKQTRVAVTTRRLNAGACDQTTGFFANMSGPGQDSEPEAKVLLIKRLYRQVDAAVLCG